MLKTDMQIVLDNIRRADTTDLLDRITAYRPGMEPEVLGFIEDELEARGITAAEIRAHDEQCRQECLFHPDGSALTCSFCSRPAVQQGWGWQRSRGDYRGLARLLHLLGLRFPGYFRYCADHAASADRTEPTARE
jgi:hypothetical protein